MSVNVPEVIRAVASLAPLLKSIIDGFLTIHGRDRLNEEARKKLEDRMIQASEALSEIGRLGKILGRYRTFQTKVATVHSVASSLSNTFPAEVVSNTPACELLKSYYDLLRRTYANELSRFGTRRYFDVEDERKIADLRGQIDREFSAADAFWRSSNFDGVSDSISKMEEYLNKMIVIANERLDDIIDQLEKLG